MITYGKPSVAALERFLVGQVGAAFSYPDPGCSLRDAGGPRGFRYDRTQGLIGHGTDAFERARAAVGSWLMFDQPETAIYPPDMPLVPECHVVVSAGFGPLWITGACRIVDVVDDEHQFGFAYGTLSHPLRGEELFLVTMREDGSVWFSVDVYSRTQSRLGTAILPVIRSMQRRFRQQAVARIAIASREARPVS